MTKKKSKVKVITFRQRLRAQSEERLDKMLSVMGTAAQRVCEETNTEINPYDLMRLACNRQTKGLRYKLTSELSNEVENELEAIYNKQQALALGEDNG
jgi:hypothetical protein